MAKILQNRKSGRLLNIPGSGGWLHRYRKEKGGSRKPCRREKKTMMYRKCERCGANLDWGEKCDCGQQEGRGTYSHGERTERRNDCTGRIETRAGREGNKLPLR